MSNTDPAKVIPRGMPDTVSAVQTPMSDHQDDFDAEFLDEFMVTQAPEKVQRSLFGEILDWMLVPLLLLWPMSIAVTYLVAKSIANVPFDRALDDRVTVLAQQVKEVNGKLVGRLPVAARDILRADDVDSVFYQVIGPDNAFIDGDRDMPPPSEEEKPQTWTIYFRDDHMRSTEIRVAYTYVDLRSNSVVPGEANTPQLALVQVGESLDKRAQLANQIIKGVILPEFIILPIALALVWFALTRGLSPLSELQKRIRERRPDDLSPIETGLIPEEISPLVRSMNEMLARLSQTIQMQKRFIADAAHQMKTPLAGMRMQSELALRQTNSDEVHRSLEQLAKSSQSATHLVNQLLSLARAENQTPLMRPFVLLELAELARNVVQDLFPSAIARDIDIGFEQPGHPVMVIGNPTTLREMLSNLVDNAIRYTPPAGTVTVRVRADLEDGYAYLEVEDTGPGIVAAERQHVFERFYRILGSHVEGSGLGLAIVREIALQHDAVVDIFDNPRSKDPRFSGCLLRVTLTMQSRTAFIEDIG